MLRIQYVFLISSFLTFIKCTIYIGLNLLFISFELSRETKCDEQKGKERAKYTDRFFFFFLEVGN